MGLPRRTVAGEAGSLEAMAGTVNRLLPGKVDGCPAAPLPWLFPLRCLVCGEPGAHARDLCAACHASLPWQGPACPRCALPAQEDSPGDRPCAACLATSSPLDRVHAVFDYAFPLDRLLPRLKFHGDFAAGRVLAQCMVEALTNTLADADRPAALLPLPLHRARLRQRGYDQALELARPLAHALRLPLLAGVLQRARATHAQSRLDAETRQRNLRGAFTVMPRCLLPDHIALVDDVMTTGATLHAAAQALHAAGVQRVDAWVCARVA
jgi:ComF family protein